MKARTAGLIAGALTAALVAGCVGDGDGLDLVDPDLICTSYPDDPDKCWKPWNGHIIQTCGEAGEIETRLYFDRPEVPDSARVNIMDLGSLQIDTLRGGYTLNERTNVCDRGVCRILAVKFRVFEYVYPRRSASADIEFTDSSGMIADGGLLSIDDVVKSSCP